MERENAKVANESFTVTNKQLHDRGKSKDDQTMLSEVSPSIPPHPERNSRRYRQQSSVGPADEGKYLKHKHEDSILLKRLQFLKHKLA